MNTTLACTGLNVRAGNRQLVTDLTIEFPVGSFTCVLGLNGAGKTLTLHTLSGIRTAASGKVLLEGDELGRFSRREIATRLGLLLQTQEDAFPTTVEEAILMGAYAQNSLWQQETAGSHARLEEILSTLDLLNLRQRLTDTLSGGERRRVALGTMLLQNPDIWLLDEPTNHLDPLHQLAIMEQLSELKQQDKTIIASIHDPLIATRYADYALLLYGDGSWEFGNAGKLISSNNLSRLYGLDYQEISGAAHRVLVPA